MAFNSRWAALLTAARDAAGLTQEDVAHAIGVRAVQVSRWERGKVIPRDIHRLALTRLFGCSISDLFPYDDDNGDEEMAS